MLNVLKQDIMGGCIIASILYNPFVIYFVVN
ncbi:hypothetical protein M316_0037 [Nitrincola phage 1M3-16]|nr:hypothetical protein GJ22_gp115 [Nitrincola phage 1M3-16]AHX01102.1 hypothetical protein M316_0037 [Nitrincola phage 1M3-16]